MINVYIAVFIKAYDAHMYLKPIVSFCSSYWSPDTLFPRDFTWYFPRHGMAFYALMSGNMFTNLLKHSNTIKL